MDGRETLRGGGWGLGAGGWNGQRAFDSHGGSPASPQPQIPSPQNGGGSGLVAWPVFKTATEAPSAAPVGSIPTRSRHFALALLAALLVIGAADASAQTPPPPAARPARTTLADTNQLRIKGVKPLPAFFMSLAVPGWGQARLDRKLTAGLFVMFEGISVGMSMKTVRELKYLERTGADTALITSKRRQKQDWFFLWGFNHLFSGLESFVASELHTFPTDVRFQVIPQGVAFEGRIPIRIR